MSAKTVVNQPIILADTQTYDWDRYTLQVEGSAQKSQRRMTVTVPIVNGDGTEISRAVVALTGDAFGAFWSGFHSDKQIAELVLNSRSIIAPIDDVPDSIVNAKSA